MHYDFSIKIRGIDGKPLVDAVTKEEATVQTALVNALTAEYRDEKIEGSEKMKRWVLAERIHSNKEIDLTAEEASLLKNLVGKAFGPIVVGPVWNALDHPVLTVEG